MSKGEGLYKAYQRAGPGFLALRMEPLFTKIESEEDRVLHNAALSDVLQIIEGEEKRFFGRLTDWILNNRIKKSVRKRWLFRVAKQVLEVGQAKMYKKGK